MDDAEDLIYMENKITKVKNIDITHSHGFFSNCYMTLREINGESKPDTMVHINWPRQDYYRNKDQENKNLFYFYFKENQDYDPSILKQTGIPHPDRSKYKDGNFAEISPYIKTFFQLSDVVKSRKGFLLRKYAIEPLTTIAVCYRGTDKWKEVAPVSVEIYIKHTKRLLENDKKLKVLIQTDDFAARKRFVEEFGDRIIFFDELPVTSSNAPLHSMSQKDRGTSNFDFGVNLLAAVSIMSECKYVITYTGSMGLWIVLSRNTAKNTIQICPRSLIKNLLFKIPFINEIVRNKYRDLYSKGYKHSGHIAVDSTRDGGVLESTGRKIRKLFSRDAVTIECSAGLCNRLRVLFSAYHASKITGKELRFIWPVNGACHAAFSDLFENKEFHFIDPSPLSRFFSYKLLFGSKISSDQTMFNIVEADLRNTIVLSFYSLFDTRRFPGHQEYQNEANKIFSTLRPVKFIRDEVDNFASKNFDTKIMGLHIRRGDFHRTRPEITSNLSDYLEEMDSFLKRHPEGKFFVATDDSAPDPYGNKPSKTENIIENLISIYGKEKIVYYPTRSLNRGKKEAIQDALITLLLLMKTDEFVGHKVSSFAEMVMANFPGTAINLQSKKKIK